MDGMTGARMAPLLEADRRRLAPPLMAPPETIDQIVHILRASIVAAGA